MKEEYLHHIWKMKRLPWQMLRLTDGRPLIVNHVGNYNANENGPDFQQGCVTIDGIKWYGSIELHVKSSDWFKHKHQTDKNYDNVVLHVVYQDDEPVFVNNQKIPTLELKSFIDETHFRQYQHWQTEKTTFPCKPFFASLPSLYFLNMQTRALHQRLNRKTNFLENYSPWEALCLLAARAIGKNLHQDNFMFIVQELIAQEIRTEIYSFWEEKILFIKSELETKNLLLWKTKGNRPSKNDMEILTLLSFQLLNKIHFEPQDEPFENIKHLWNKILDELQIKQGILFQNLQINAFIPWLYWMSEKFNRGDWYDYFYDELTNLPKENNRITRLWEKHLCSIENAAQSQSVIEIYKQFCTPKRCLECTIGNKIMNP